MITHIKDKHVIKAKNLYLVIKSPTTYTNQKWHKTFNKESYPKRSKKTLHDRTRSNWKYITGNTQ